MCVFVNVSIYACVYVSLYSCVSVCLCVRVCVCKRQLSSVKTLFPSLLTIALRAAKPMFPDTLFLLPWFLKGLFLGKAAHFLACLNISRA